MGREGRIDIVLLGEGEGLRLGVAEILVGEGCGVA